MASFVWGCGGGGGIDIGSGQSADPVAVDYPLFYVKRPLFQDDAGEIVQTDVRELLPVEYGADLYMRERASSNTAEINLTGAITGGFGDIRDVSVSYDGERVLFSMRTPIDPDAAVEDQPTWNIWEYNTSSRSLRRIIVDDITAEEGDDVGPQYLADDRIVFTSTRQNESVAKLTDQGRPQFAALDETGNEPAFVLHVMNDDGTDITQISFNQSHDLYPSLLDNGRIVFSRWDAIAGKNAISLYTARPDGTEMQLLYGAQSHSTGSYDADIRDRGVVQFIEPRELPDGRIVATLMPFSGTYGAGDLVLIDVENYVNEEQPTLRNAGGQGPGQQSATMFGVTTIPGISPGGRFGAVWPMWDGSNRLLVSWTPCLLHIGDRSAPIEFCNTSNQDDPRAVEAEPSFGIWSYDLSARTLNPVIPAELGFAITDIAIAQPRPRPVPLLDLDESGMADASLVDEGAAILHIRSVYDFDGTNEYADTVYDFSQLADPALTTADERPARFVRIYKAVGIPDEDTLDFDPSAFGLSSALGMRELVGYAPVEPDGSVMVKVPADVPLAIDVLDRQGHRIFPRHRNWLQVRPGEVRECGGCHDPAREGVSHGRDGVFEPLNAGAPVDGYVFPNTSIGTSADFGETMAETRIRLSCFVDCAALEPSVDLVYEDVWTDDTVRAPDEAFSLSYSDIVDTEVPELSGCLPWTVDCRVIINYEQHIQPLWEVPREAIGPETAMSCVDCHALRDAGGILIDPADRGQLELTRSPSSANANHFVSYRELLAGDTLEAIIDGTVQQERRFQGNFDENGNPIAEPVSIGSRMSLGGAVASAGFFERFTQPGSHQGWMSDAELRLVAEWLDLGGQYFNDPFNEDVPLN